MFFCPFVAMPTSREHRGGGRRRGKTLQGDPPPPQKKNSFLPECTTVASKWLRLRMRILTHPEEFVSEFAGRAKSHTKGCKKGFANAMAKLLFLLRKFLANGRLRQNSLAIAHAMAWCTQSTLVMFCPSPQGNSLSDSLSDSQNSPQVTPQQQLSECLQKRFPRGRAENMPQIN